MYPVGDLHILQGEIERNVADITLNGVSVMNLAPSEVIRHPSGWGMVLTARERTAPTDNPRVWIDGQRKKIINYGWVEVHFAMIPIKVKKDWSVPENIAADVADATGLTFPLMGANVRFTIVSGRQDPSNVGVVDILDDGTVTLTLPFSNVPRVNTYTFTTGPIAL